MKRRIFVATTVLCVLCAWLAVTLVKDHRAKHFVQTHSTVVTRPLNIFEWRGVDTTRLSTYDATLASLQQQGYQTVFVAYDASAAANTASYEQQLAAYGKLLSRYHLQLGLVAGGPTWEKPEITNVLAFAQIYNASDVPRITAITFDIEPYVAGASTTQTAKTLVNLAGSITDNDSSISVGFTAPFWLVQDRTDTQRFLTDVATLPHGFVTVMDYRTATSGHNGSLALAAPFFALDKAGATIYVGLDASDSTPRSTTFFGQSASALRLAQYAIDQAEHSHANFGGQTVNDVQGLSDLKDP